MDILKLTWEMEGGVDGEDGDPNNPLSRALGKLFSDGQPFIRLMQCFCADRRQQANHSILRWLGVFILSAGGRIIFFPGFRSAKQYVEGFRGKAQMWKEGFEFDHISLEKGFRRWHITSRGSKLQLGGPKTTELSQQRFLWCGLSVSSLDELRIVRHRTKVIGRVPESDAKRRYEVFLKSRERAKFQLLEWHNHVWEKGLDGFWHFGLIISPPQSSTYTGGTLGFPEGSPFLAAPPTRKACSNARATPPFGAFHGDRASDNNGRCAGRFKSASELNCAVVA
ncbi:MAG: hypothetical protein ACE5GV_09365 [Candidatus Scalindua sp.]